MPLLAEIADKMPTLETVWMTWTVVGLVAAAVTVVLALLKLWIGAAAVVVSAGIGILAYSDSLDSAIIRELGSDYLLQNKMAPFVPSGFAFIGWCVVAGKRRWKIKDS